MVRRWWNGEKKNKQIKISCDVTVSGCVLLQYNPFPVREHAQPLYITGLAVHFRHGSGTITPPARIHPRKKFCSGRIHDEEEQYSLVSDFLSRFRRSLLCCFFFFKGPVYWRVHLCYVYVSRAREKARAWVEGGRRVEGNFVHTKPTSLIWRVRKPGINGLPNITEWLERRTCALVMEREKLSQFGALRYVPNYTDVFV